MSIDPVVAALIAEGITTTASAFARGVARQIHTRWQGDEVQAELRRVLESALSVGFEDVLSGADPLVADHVTSVVGRFLVSPGVPQALFELVTGSGSSLEWAKMDELRSMLASAGYEADGLAEALGVDPDRFLAPFLRELAAQLEDSASKPQSPLFNAFAAARLTAIQSEVVQQSLVAGSRHAELLQSIQSLRLSGSNGPATQGALLTGLLPPALEAHLEDLIRAGADGANLVRTLLMGAGQSPSVVIRDVIRHELPAWFVKADARVRELVGDLAAAYNAHEQARLVYESMAADGLAPRASLLVRAGLAAINAGRSVEASQLFAQAQSFHGGVFLVEVCEAVVEDRLEDVARATDPIPDDLPDRDRQMVLMFRAQALNNLGFHDEALRLLEQLASHSQQSTVIQLLKAQTLLRRASVATGDERAATLGEAERLALDVRDSRRQWSGPSWEGAAVACQVALMRGDLRAVVRYGSNTPDGEARDEESGTPTVMRFVALAARELGDIEKARLLTNELGDSYSALLIDGKGSLDPETLWRSAYQKAADDMQRFEAQFNLARLGIDDLPGLGEWERKDPERAALLRATSLGAQGRFAAAARELRPFATISENAAWALATSYADAGQNDAAIREFQRLADRFGSTQALAEKARILSRGEQWSETCEVVASALSRPVDRELTRELRRLGAQAAFHLRRWSQSAAYLRAMINDEGDSADLRWSLVGVLWNQREFHEAWIAMSEPTFLVPDARENAQLYVLLRSRFAPDSETIRRLVLLAHEHGQDEETAALALNSVFRITALHHEVDFADDAVAEWREAVDSFTTVYPESTYLRVVSGDPATLAADIRERLLPGAALGHEMARAVARGLMPYGMLAAQAGRPLAQALIQRAAIVIPAGATEPEDLDKQLSMCRKRLDSVVVIDASALNTLSLVPSLWDKFIAAYEGIELPAEVYDDLIETEDALRLRSTRSLSIDPQSGLLIPLEVTEETADQAFQRASWLVRKARTLRIVEVGQRIVHDQQADGDPRFKWLLPLDRALEAGLPLVADDPAFRALATQQGIETFGTIAWLLVQAEVGLLSQLEVAAALRDLARSYVVDIPIANDDIVEIAAEHGYAPSPAGYALSRRSTWVDLESGLALYTRLLEGSAAAERSLIPFWLVHGALGFASVHRPGLEVMGAGILLGSTAHVTQASSAELAMWLGNLRVAMAAWDFVGDPLDAMVRHLVRLLTEEAGPSGALTQLRFLLAGLEANDQFKALREIYRMQAYR